MQDIHTSSYSRILPGIHDVIAGQGRVNQSHPGNVKYQAILAENEEEFCKALTKEKKQEIAQAAIYEIEATGGRFLRFDHSLKQWFQLNEVEVYAKVSQALRYRRRQIKSNSKTNSDLKPYMSLDKVFEKHKLARPQQQESKDWLQASGGSWDPNSVPVTPYTSTSDLPLNFESYLAFQDPGTSSQQEEVLYGDAKPAALDLPSHGSSNLPRTSQGSHTKVTEESAWTLAGTGGHPDTEPLFHPRLYRPVIESPHFTTEQLLRVLKATVYETDDED